MKKFVLLIFLFLMCFLFMIPGATFAGIVPEAGQTIEQVGGSAQTWIDDKAVEYSISATMLGVLDGCLILKQDSGTFDNQTTIKNTEEKNIVSKAGSRIAPENGTVLKGPRYPQYPTGWKKLETGV